MEPGSGIGMPLPLLLIPIIAGALSRLAAAKVKGTATVQAAKIRAAAKTASRKEPSVNGVRETEETFIVAKGKVNIG